MGGRIGMEREGRVAWMILDHPERHNAISAEMWLQLGRVAEILERDPSVRVVILRGAGDAAFASGGDISEFEAGGASAAMAAADQSDLDPFLGLRVLSKPLIAHIHGYCLGGGCGLALAADLRYAADDAVFAIPAARLGRGYPVAGLEMLVQVVGFAAAKEIFFTARRFTAAEALRMGLVNQVLPKGDLDAFVRATAEDIASNAPLTLRSAKLIFSELARDPALRDHDAMLRSIRDCHESVDFAEGVRAFLDKRRPSFTGR
ncbi:MAG: enoyl-CoA hydratase [Deltaproteobacteria bacterium]|nr:enoyl-CoA hydratase [Deltaproteobacteria bacterium]